MMVSSHGIESRRSPSQSNHGSMTTLLGAKRRAVALILLQIRLAVSDLIAEQRIVPVDRAIDRLGVGIEQQLGGIESMPIGRVHRGHEPGIRSAGRDGFREGKHATRSRSAPASKCTPAVGFHRRRRRGRPRPRWHFRTRGRNSPRRHPRWRPADTDSQVMFSSGCVTLRDQSGFA